MTDWIDVINGASVNAAFVQRCARRLDDQIALINAEGEEIGIAYVMPEATPIVVPAAPGTEALVLDFDVEEDCVCEDRRAVIGWRLVPGLGADGQFDARPVLAGDNIEFSGAWTLLFHPDGKLERVGSGSFFDDEASAWAAFAARHPSGEDASNE